MGMHFARSADQHLYPTSFVDDETGIDVADVSKRFGITSLALAAGGAALTKLTGDSEYFMGCFLGSGGAGTSAVIYALEKVIAPRRSE